MTTQNNLFMSGSRRVDVHVGKLPENPVSQSAADVEQVAVFFRSLRERLSTESPASTVLMPDSLKQKLVAAIRQRQFNDD